MQHWFGWSLLSIVLGTGVLAACSVNTNEAAYLARHAADTSGDDDDSTAAGTGTGAGSSSTSTTTARKTGSTSGTSATGGTSGSSSTAATGATSTGTGAPTTLANDPFAGADAFAPQSSGSGKHNAGQDCMNGCHDHGFTFAGTLFDANGNAVSNAEIRLVDASGNAISVYSASNGNFYTSEPWTPPAYVGARDDTGKLVMATAIDNGGCNGCHSAEGTTSPVHL